MKWEEEEEEEEEAGEGEVKAKKRGRPRKRKKERKGGKKRSGEERDGMDEDDALLRSRSVSSQSGSDSGEKEISVVVIYMGLVSFCRIMDTTIDRCVTSIDII